MPNSILHYEIIEKLGEGGMGVVHLARDTKLKRYVALKFLPGYISTNSKERDRFRQEAQAAAGLNHPNIAQVYAIEETEEELFIVMEYVEGRELKDAIKEGSLEAEQKRETALQIAQGIRAAHRRGIVHRDIKSGNIMIDPEGRVKIMDFGLARVQGSAQITKTGTTIGTTAYMSPEQLASNDVDARSDIWSYGVVLYELFSGELPFQGVYEPAIMYAISEEDPAPLSEIDPQIPGRLQTVIDRCLVKDRDRRYQSMDEVVEDLTGEDPIGELPAAPSTASRSSEHRFMADKASYLYVGLPVVVTLLLLFFLLRSSMPWQASSVPEKKYLAVLPIENIGGNPGLQAICDGLAETFSFRLSELEKYKDSYWVAPASEMRREKINSATQANKIFGVNLAVISSI
ncbi:MAG: serine/threonine-protein kinase, partial [Balneolaceae bacterium]|nr:serine/threonine-protein kinase [Balneolaceae bacterium]